MTRGTGHGTSRSWRASVLPASNDKYLPVWVILAMTASVFLLSCQMTQAVKDVCAVKDGCAKPALRAEAAEAAKPKAGTSAAAAASAASSAR